MGDLTRRVYVFDHSGITVRQKKIAMRRRRSLINETTPRRGTNAESHVQEYNKMVLCYAML